MSFYLEIYCYAVISRMTSFDCSDFLTVITLCGCLRLARLQATNDGSSSGKYGPVFMAEHDDDLGTLEKKVDDITIRTSIYSYKHVES